MGKRARSCGQWGEEEERGRETKEALQSQLFSFSLLLLAHPTFSPFRHPLLLIPQCKLL